MTLTEQWKKGELEDGFYYVEEDGKTFISICRKHYLFQVLQDCKVLAPIPTYEEWQELTAWNKEYKIREKNYGKSYEALKKENTQLHKFLEEFNALDVAKENQQLKEVLKECGNLINECISGDYMKELCERIDEVLK